MSNLSIAIKLAIDTHEGQHDKNGEPYILHPLRVMLTQTSEQARIAAVLHDVVEDGDIRHEDILAMFGRDVHAAVFALTRQDTEEYLEFVRRAKTNKIARAVKIADVRDNLRPGAPHLQERYKRALAILESDS